MKIDICVFHKCPFNRCNPLSKYCEVITINFLAEDLKAQNKIN